MRASPVIGSRFRATGALPADGLLSISLCRAMIALSDSDFWRCDFLAEAGQAVAEMGLEGLEIFEQARFFELIADLLESLRGTGVFAAELYSGLGNHGDDALQLRGLLSDQSGNPEVVDFHGLHGGPGGNKQLSRRNLIHGALPELIHFRAEFGMLCRIALHGGRSDFFEEQG